ncbi:hypothetical protein ACS0PU_007105 [Formica fusca]
MTLFRYARICQSDTCSCDTRASRHRATVQTIRHGQREEIFVTLRIISSDTFRLRTVHVLYFAEMSLSFSEYLLAGYYTPLAKVAMSASIAMQYVVLPYIHVVPINALKDHDILYYSYIYMQ